MESDSEDLTSDGEDMSSTTSRPLDERLVAVIIGITVVAISLLLGIVLFCILRRRYGRKKYIACGVGVRSADMCRVPSVFPPAVSDLSIGVRQVPTTVIGNGKMLSNGIMYNSVETCDDAEVSIARLSSSQHFSFHAFAIYRQPRSCVFPSFLHPFTPVSHDVISLYSRPTQPSIPLGSVNGYQLRLGRQRQVWFIPLADERGVCR